MGKISNRVSLRFNPEDEEQKIALYILSHTHRAKSKLISKALVIMYDMYGGDIDAMLDDLEEDVTPVRRKRVRTRPATKKADIPIESLDELIVVEKSNTHTNKPQAQKVNTEDKKEYIKKEVVDVKEEKPKVEAKEDVVEEVEDAQINHDLAASLIDELF